MSTRRDLIYRMSADPEAFKKGMREAGQDSKMFWRELKELEKQQQAVDDVTTTTGMALLGFGAAVGAGLGVAAKAAIDWESAWTGVVKVVDGTPEQLAALEQELRDMAMVLPQTHAEIAGVAAAAGQLGIAREDIGKFTEVMVAMGVSTNLASEEAATALARMMNIMGTAPEEVDKLGSAIVGLGNTSATTEAEIVEMALRIAGAGETVGMTEAEVLGFAAALSSVGIEAESGGSSISVAMVKISEAVNEGGEALSTFAQVAGVTADEFATQFRTDPAAAIDSFVQGLGRMQDSGGDVFAVLESLGMSEIRLRDALLRLANAGDLLNETLETGRTAWEENSALMEEAARRYGTTEAQIQIARNQLVDMGIDIGEGLLPVVHDLLDTGTGMLAWIKDMPGPLKEALTNLGMFAAVLAIARGAAQVASVQLGNLSGSLNDMGKTRAAGALSRVSGILAGPWSFAIGGAIALVGMWVAEQAQARARSDELSSTLDEQTSAVTGNTRAWIANELETSGALETAQRLGIDLETLVSAIAGEGDAIAEVNSILEEHKEELELQGETIGGTVKGVETLTGSEAELDALIRQLTGDLDSATESHERKREATGASATAADEASGAEQVLAETLGITAEAAGGAADAFSDLDEKVRALIDSAFALNGAERDVEAGIDAVTEKLAENGATIDANTESGRENQVAIEDQIAAIAALAITTAEQTGSTEEANAVLDEHRQQLIEVMRQTGFTEAEIDDYIGVLDAIPGEIETAIETRGVAAAIRSAEQIQRELDAIDRFVTISFEHRHFQSRGGISVPGLADGGYVGFADGGIVGYPDGGYVRGPGGPRTDSILARVSNGEFVVNAESTRQNRDLLEAINSGQGGRVNRPGRRFSASSPEGVVRVFFDFANVSDDFARAIKKTVRDDGGGIVQTAFGTR